MTTKYYTYSYENCHFKEVVPAAKWPNILTFLVLYDRYGREALQRGIRPDTLRFARVYGGHYA